MDPFVNLEPTPSAYRAVSTVPDGVPIRFVSLIRLRRDQTDGVVDRKLSQWNDVLAAIRSTAGGTVLTKATVMSMSSEQTGAWDSLIVTEFASRDMATKFLNDERWIDSYKLRREAVELCPTILTTPSPFVGRSIANAADYGPPIDDPEQMSNMGPVIAAARCLPAGAAFLIVNAIRLRRDRSPALARAAYAGWRMVFNAVCDEIGAENILNDTVEITLIGADQRWDFLNMVRYPNLDALQILLSDPRVQAASAMRLAGIDDSIAMLCHDVQHANDLIAIR
jgi:uncharacterized protein (DUF1330 family)